MVDPAVDVPEVRILLLGDSGVGKSTFVSRLTLGSNGIQTKSTALPVLRDLEQPFSLDIRLYNRPYRFNFYDTASPTNYTLLEPAVIVLCYSIAEPVTLGSVQDYWAKFVESHYNHGEQLPVILLGLMRDVRQKEDYDDTNKPMDLGGLNDDDVLIGRRIVHPQQALRVAQMMRWDRYCECSAMTGELCREVFEDIARTAALTTTDKGGKSEGIYCNLM